MGLLFMEKLVCKFTKFVKQIKQKSFCSPFQQSRIHKVMPSLSFSYQLPINTSPFKHKSLPIRQRIQSQYLPKYWRKLKMDQNILTPNQQDRLSKLTIKQIDRIIDMEKIKYALNSKKMGQQQQLYLDKFIKGKNKHPNVYRANFLAKINKIAIQRNIYTEQPEGFQSIYGQFNPESIRKRELEKQKQNIKYVKVYKSNHLREKNKLSLQKMKAKNQFNIDDEKTIATIQSQYDLIDFQDKLNRRKSENRQQAQAKSLLRRKNSLIDDKRLLCSRRWFNGMSTHYIEKKNFFKDYLQKSKGGLKPRGVDISSVVQSSQSGSIQTNNGRYSFFNNRRVKTEQIDLNEKYCKIKQSIDSIASDKYQLITSPLDTIFDEK